MKKNFRQSFQEKATVFMAGRNGMDYLARFMLYFSLALLILSTILVAISKNNATAATILEYLAFLILILSYARSFSRKLDKRRNENLRYLKIVYPIRNWFTSKKNRLKMRKDYKLFTCPTCKTTLRVPKGKGRINLTCPKCQTKFAGKS